MVNKSCRRQHVSRHRADLKIILINSKSKPWWIRWSRVQTGRATVLSQNCFRGVARLWHHTVLSQSGSDKVSALLSSFKFSQKLNILNLKRNERRHFTAKFAFFFGVWPPAGQEEISNVVKAPGSIVCCLPSTIWDFSSFSFYCCVENTAVSWTFSHATLNQITLHCNKMITGFSIIAIWSLGPNDRCRLCHPECHHVAKMQQSTWATSEKYQVTASV